MTQDRTSTSWPGCQSLSLILNLATEILRNLRRLQHPLYTDQLMKNQGSSFTPELPHALTRGLYLKENFHLLASQRC